MLLAFWRNWGDKRTYRSQESFENGLTMDRKPVRLYITNRPHRFMSTIAHSVRGYLSLTAHWLYDLFTGISAFDQIVFAERREQIDEFPFSPVYAWADCSPIRRRVERLSQRVLRLPDRPYRLMKAKKHKACLIHSHFGTRGFRDIGLAKALGIKHVTSFYGRDATALPLIEPQWKESYQRLFDCCDLILAEGPQMRKTICELGCPAEKVKVQRIGVNLDRIPVRTRKIGRDRNVNILIAGSFVEKKGIPYAVESVGIAHKHYSNIRLTIVGDAINTGIRRESSLQEKKRIVSLVKKYDLEGVTEFKGYLSYGRLLEEAYKAHIFVSPSVTASDGDSEGGSPVAITEFSASGMPILSTFHCDIPEVVRHNESGLLAAERDVEALANNLITLIENPERWGPMGLKGRKHVEENFNLRRQVRLLEQRYEGLLS